MVYGIVRNSLALIGKWALIIAGAIISLPILLGTAIVTFIIQIILKMIKTIKENVPKIRDAIVQMFKDAFMAVVDKVEGWMATIMRKISEGFSDVKITISGAVSKVKGAIGLESKQMGGFIPETKPYLLHKGEYVLPAGRRFAPVNITITGNTFMSDEEAAEKIGDMILEKVKMNLRI